MPIEKVIKNGQTCYRWGKQGKVYCGKGAAQKAAKQGIAEDGPEKFKQEMSKAGKLYNKDISDLINEAIASEIEFQLEHDQTFAYIPEHEREKIPVADFAGPHRSFPIRDAKDARNAFKLAGHAANPDAVRAKIKAICKRKGIPIPDSEK